MSLPNVHPIASTSLSVTGGTVSWVCKFLATVDQAKVDAWVYRIGGYAGAVAAVLGLILLVHSFPGRWRKKQ